MSRLRYLTAGESHGKGLLGILDGVPRGLQVDIESINRELCLRQNGYGRGPRRYIESDEVDFWSGLRGSITTGNPVSFVIRNKDYWSDDLSCINGTKETKTIHRPRPGHADYAGTIKYNTVDARDISERASARESAATTVIGSICGQLLFHLGIVVYAVVSQIGNVVYQTDYKTIDNLSRVNTEIVGCYDSNIAKLMIEEIDRAKINGDSVGGKVTLIAKGMPAGMGSCSQYDRKLEYEIGGYLSSVGTVKSVEFGLGSSVASKPGSQVHDQMFYDNQGTVRYKSNNAGGLEGGMSNGQDIVVTCGLKPVPTIARGLSTVDLVTKTNEVNVYERSDHCHVPSAAIVLKNILNFCLAKIVLDQLGGDTMQDVAKRLHKEQ